MSLNYSILPHAASDRTEAHLSQGGSIPISITRHAADFHVRVLGIGSKRVRSSSTISVNMPALAYAPSTSEKPMLESCQASACVFTVGEYEAVAPLP